MTIWWFYFAFAFVMERPIISPRFSFACAFIVNTLGTQRESLGGHFGPEKKYLAPPPKFPKSPQTPSRPLGPSPSWRTPPPPGIFDKNRTPPPPDASDSPLPLPEQKRPPKNLKSRDFYFFTYTIGVEIIAKAIPQTILLINVIDYTN